MNIYFSGIGGVGIGPLAEIANDAGYKVTGSDPEETLIVRELRQKGITVFTNQDGSSLLNCHNNCPIDWFVYTAALPQDHPELLLAKKIGIKIAKRDELLAFIIQEKNLKLLAITGTHGKTTTTGMAIWAFKELGLPVSYSIGTTTKFCPSGHYSSESEYFIYECDEFDRNFLNFNPFFSIITSIDYDHPDTYPTAQNYLDAFREFAEKSGHVISWQDQHSEIYDGMANTELFSTDEVNENIKLAGNHNRRNATLVQKMLKSIGINQDTDEIMSNFPGTNRRFEKLAENVYSDYAHHPVEIAATLQMARELSDHITLIYQPHQNIRQHEIRDQYQNQFELAEEIYWLPTYLAREDPNLPILTAKDLTQNITNKDIIQIADFNDELWAHVQQARDRGNLIIFMGAGKIDSWARNKLDQENNR